MTSTLIAPVIPSTAGQDRGSGFQSPVSPRQRPGLYRSWASCAAAADDVRAGHLWTVAARIADHSLLRPASWYDSVVRLGFSLCGLRGHVDINLGATDDPDAVGAHPGALSLPMCEATVSYPGRGYRGQFGWIQLVRSTDNRSGGAQFEADPLEILGDVAHPFCFFGIRPTLFDAPARGHRPDMDWVAHSFLAFVGGNASRDVRTLCGFSWGFAIAAGRISLLTATPLPAEVWNDHVSMLAGSYPDWTFSGDFWTA